MLFFFFSKVGNLFGSRRSTIITLYNGAFGSSSAIFLFFKVRDGYVILSIEKSTGYFHAHVHLLPSHCFVFLFCFLSLQLIYESGISLRASFLFLSACSIIHLLRTLFLMPRKVIPYPLPDNYTYGYWWCAPKMDNIFQSIISKTFLIPFKK